MWQGYTCWVSAVNVSKIRAPTTCVNAKSINWYNNFHSLNFLCLAPSNQTYRDWKSRVLHPAHLLAITFYLFLALVVPFLYNLLWDVWLISWVFCVKAHSEISCRTIISLSDADLGNDIEVAPSGFCPNSGTLLIHNSLYMQSLENSLKKVEPHYWVWLTLLSSMMAVWWSSLNAWQKKTKKKTDETRDQDLYSFAIKMLL